MQTRQYQKKKTIVKKFVKKTGKVDHSAILNGVDVDYDTLAKILEDLRHEGYIK
jgi:predicted transcriptional regulator